MTRLAAGLVVAVLVCAAIARAQAPTFRARADLVSIDVGVRQRGRPVTGLTAADFELIDNGVPQKISQLAYESLPIDVTVALDISQSVSGSVLDSLRRGVQELAKDLAPTDRLRLLTFNVRITRQVDFDAGPGAVDAAFNGLRPSGPTALRDAIAVALTVPSQPDRRQLVVVFSDGDDQGSVTTPEVLLDVVRRTTPTLGLVLTPAYSESMAKVTQTFTQLASETGGFVEIAEENKSLTSAFQKILTDFRRSYVLYFAPEDVTRSGVHSVEVRVKRPGVDVHSRKAYTSK